MSAPAGGGVGVVMAGEGDRLDGEEGACEEGDGDDGGEGSCHERPVWRLPRRFHFLF